MSQGKKGRVSRRAFLGTVGGFAASLGIVGSGWLLSAQNGSMLQKNLDETKTEQQELLTKLDEARSGQEKILKSLDGYVAYGGGSNIKYMPDPVTGKPTVPLEEVWHFDLDRAFCRVDNNPQAFAMDTHKMGRVIVDANSFSMVMLTRDVQIPEFSVTPGGPAKLRMTGDISCSTVASVANTKVGGRDVIEPAPFEIVAVHDDKVGDSFAFTVSFQPDQAPLNYAIFGPKFTFTGKMQTGGVTIKSIKNLLPPG